MPYMRDAIHESDLARFDADMETTALEFLHAYMEDNRIKVDGATETLNRSASYATSTHAAAWNAQEEEIVKQLMAKADAAKENTGSNSIHGSSTTTQPEQSGKDSNEARM